DGIYYDISKFPGYGKLSRINLDELKNGARVEVNDEKRSPADFAIWKKAPKEHIMQWPSPWGMGYPGWHIECSAIGLKYLGPQFDIHTGGVDHIPIHHENEIAQGEGLNGCVPARFWLHGEFMLVDGGKMSKSLGNTYTVSQLMERGYDPLDFRYLCLNSHYRQKLNFTFEAMDGAKKSLSNLRAAAARHRGANEAYDSERLNALKAEFDESIADDLNIPKALGDVWSMARFDAKNDDIYKMIIGCDAILGLELDREVKPEEKPCADDALDTEINERIAARAAAKKAKNYAEADAIRAELAARGITLTDTPQGTKYEIKK
ncbi:MAG: cysteine--tRNA ligase, partial [Eubacteriales bacterium]